MASASQSTPSSASVPTVSQSASSSSVVAAPAPAPTSSTPRPSSAPSSTPAVSTPAPAASTTPRSTSTSTSSHSSSSSSSSTHVAPAQTTVFVAPPESHGSSSVNVVAPIAAVAGILIIIYVAYRIYLLHKRRKDEKVPPPPPRMPAIFDRPQSVMYQNSPLMMTPGSAPPSYRQSMRPVSMLYNPDSSSSSSLPTKGALTSASGHSTPTQPGFPVADETGRQSPLPYPPHDQRSFRGGGMPPRPHSVASFGSNRYSSYGSPRTPYMNRVEVVLPQPLAPEASSALSSASARQSRFSTYHGPPNPDMRPRSMILPPLAITPEGDWTQRVTMTAEERASSSIDHSSPPPPPPPKDRPKSAILLSGTSSSATSRDHAMPGGYPSSPAARARSVSPPEPLLASGVFASSSSDSTSRQHSLDVGSDEAAKAAKPKV